MIRTESLSDQVYVVLKGMIADHRFSPGARVNVEVITKELGVSRTPVWEAVRRLQQEGLLENIPNRGVFMVVLSTAKALHLYAVREVLEGLAAKEAARTFSEPALARMETLLDAQRAAVEAQDLLTYSRLDFDFHAMVYVECGNPYLREMLDSIRHKMRPMSLRTAPILGDLYQDHVALFEAFKAHDPERAEQVFLRHNRRMINLITSQAEEKRGVDVPEERPPRQEPRKRPSLNAKENDYETAGK